MVSNVGSISQNPLLPSREGQPTAQTLYQKNDEKIQLLIQEQSFLEASIAKLDSFPQQLDPRLQNAGKIPAKAP